MNQKSNILSPKQVLDMYYLDTRWHLMEIGAMLDRAERGAAAHPDDTSLVTDLRAEILREALALLATPSPEPNRAERLGTLFTKLDLRHPEASEMKGE
ncbi:MAG: hypothetical protein Q4D38_09005 [Planctomycetia bacterium]|nr:hypothetical protein [Planctomycetia bacterium]